MALEGGERGRGLSMGSELQCPQVKTLPLNPKR